MSKPKSHKSCWVVKCRETPAENNGTGWHWREYFEKSGKDRHRVYRKWGGPDWIKNHLSRKLIRERFTAGDIVVCYQVDHKEILGFTRLTSNGRKNGEFDLAPPSSAHRPTQPLTITDLRTAGCKPKAFTPKGQGTVSELSYDELEGIVAAVFAENVHEETEFLAWLKAAGLGDGSRPSNRRLPNARLPGENSTPSASQIESRLAKIEKDLAGRDDVYKVREIAAMIRRDGPLIRALKNKHKYCCQFPKCEAHIPKKDGGTYCEVAHIQSVAAGGKAKRINLVVVCPNHHKMIDYGEMEIVKNTASAITIRLNGRTLRINH